MAKLTTNLTNPANGTNEVRKLGDSKQSETVYFKEESYLINSCIYNVNKKLGSGFLEAVYQEALEIEFRNAKIPFEMQKELEIVYDGKPLKHYYVADFVCYKKIIVEIKAITKLTDDHKAQVINYLAATGFKLGLLVNFWSTPKADIIRIIR
jgi:GxxExxY protein